MRWLTFAVAAYLVLALQTGLRTLWVLPVVGGVTPDLLLILLVFVALWAPGMKVAWGALILGLLADLHPLPVLHSMQDAAILGPGVIGFLLGAYVVLQLRTMVFRDSLLTLCILTFIAGLFVQLMIVALITVRGVHLPVVSGFLADAPVPGWSPSLELLRRFLGLIYSALVAAPLGWLLLRFRNLWAFDAQRGMAAPHAR